MRWEREPMSVRRDALALLFASRKILTSGPFFSTYQNSAKADPLASPWRWNVPFPCKRGEDLAHQRLLDAEAP
jgi:hypothetical protein